VIYYQLNNNVYIVDLVITIFAIASRDLTSYMLELLLVETWRKTYTSDFPLIDVSDLQKPPFTDCHPPLTRVPRGWPKKE
jgi:hypothetical protein